MADILTFIRLPPPEHWARNTTRTLRGARSERRLTGIDAPAHADLLPGRGGDHTRPRGFSWRLFLHHNRALPALVFAALAALALVEVLP